MREPLPVRISSRASRHIRQLEEWWRRNRTAAPNAVREELQRVLGVITITPLLGTDVNLPNVRRIHITRIWQFLYYRVRTNPDRIEVLALWSDSRGEGPPI